MSYDVAFSYAAEDGARVEAAASKLAAARLTVWFDRGRISLGDEASEALIPVGAPHWDVIRAAIDQSAVFVFFDGAYWRASPYCAREHAHALARGKWIIGVESAPIEGPAPIAARRVGNAEELVAAVGDGLEVGHAHARLLAVSLADDLPVAPPSPADALLLSSVNLNEHGIFLNDAVVAAMGAAFAAARKRRRRIAVGALALLVVMALLAAFAYVARAQARRDSRAAVVAARHVASLDLATQSENATSSVERSVAARRAYRSEANPSSVSAVRDAFEAASMGVSLQLRTPDGPTGAVVADDGSEAGVADRSGGLTLVDLKSGRQVGLASVVVRSTPVLSMSADGKLVIVVRRDNGAVEVVHVRGASVTPVVGTSQVASALLTSPTEAIAVRRDGVVLVFDPSAVTPQAKQVGTVHSSVRAAALVAQRADAFELATLADDGRLDVTTIGAGRTARHVSVLVAADKGRALAPYVPGGDVVALCGARISVLTRLAGHSLSFSVPITVDRGGAVSRYGSMIFASGLACLPEGTAIESDAVQGQRASTADGSVLPGIASHATEQVRYALASSANDAWVAAAGSDGSLRVVGLAHYPRSRKLPSVAAAVPGQSTPISVDHAGVASLVPAGEAPRQLAVGVGGGAARGAYFDPEIGTVMAIGHAIFVVREGRVRERIVENERILGVRPGVFGQTVVAIPAARDHALLVSLQVPHTVEVVPFPPDTRAQGQSASDVIEISNTSRLLVATTDGYVHLLSASGASLLSRRVGPSGFTVLAAAGGKVVVGTSDGTVHLLDAETLVEQGQVHALSAELIDLEMDSVGRLVVVRSSGDNAVVLSIPALDVVTHIGPIAGLFSIAVDGGGRNVVVGADVDLTNGQHQASLTVWPLCRLCAAPLPQLLRARPAASTSPRHPTPPFRAVGTRWKH
jgi:hypothetical protein